MNNPNNGDLRLGDREGGDEWVEITVDGETISARRGEILSAALLAAGYRVLHHTHGGAPRGVFCGMGVCCECVVTVNDRPLVRACMTRVEPNLKVRVKTP